MKVYSKLTQNIQEKGGKTVTYQQDLFLHMLESEEYMAGGCLCIFRGHREAATLCCCRPLYVM